MKDVLVVLNPRKIPECMFSLAELPIPKVYIRGWTERQIADHAWGLIDFTYYDWIWVASDDIIVRPDALRAVRMLALDNPVVTGYSQRSHSEWTVNLTNCPLLDDKPGPDAYAFREFQEVVSLPFTAIPTWFAGMSLTGMSKAMWSQFPFGCYEDPGYASDFHLSFRLQEAGIPIVAAREGFCYHWRNRWEDTTDDRDAKPETTAHDIVVVST